MLHSSGRILASGELMDSLAERDPAKARQGPRWAGACAATRLARAKARDAAGENDDTPQSGCPRTHGQDAHAHTVRMPKKQVARSGN